MSTFEYNDMFLLCQDTGKYHVYSFDIEGSKKMDNKTRYDAQIKLIKLMTSIYSVLEEIQKEIRNPFYWIKEFILYTAIYPIMRFINRSKKK